MFLKQKLQVSKTFVLVVKNPKLVKFQSPIFVKTKIFPVVLY